MGVERTPTKTNKPTDASDPSPNTSASEGTSAVGSPRTNNQMLSAKSGSKRIKIPTITVPGCNHKDVATLLKPFSDNITLKRAAQGTLIYSDNLKSHEFVLSTLEKNKIDCFTSGDPNLATAKFLLYGLSDYSEAEVKDELLDMNLPVTLAKKFYTNAQSKRDTFLIGFKKSSNVNLERLRETKKLFCTAVEWKVFEERSARVTQCFNCHSFGHGSHGCKAKVSCLFCAGRHSRTECPLPKLPNGKVDPERLICALCGGKHAASFLKCPIRLGYVESLEVSRPSTKSAPIVDASPAKCRNVNPLDCAWPALPVHKRPPSQPHKEVILPNSSNPPPPRETFNINELWNIFVDFSSRLAACSTKNEQVIAIAQLTIMYILPEGHNSGELASITTFKANSSNKQNINKGLSNETSSAENKVVLPDLTCEQPVGESVSAFPDEVLPTVLVNALTNEPSLPPTMDNAFKAGRTLRSHSKSPSAGPPIQE